jgi:hypothetical protein
MENLAEPRMRTHLRYRIDRKFGELLAHGFEVVFRRETFGQQLADERVDDRIALLCRHVGLNGEGAMLTVDHIVVDQTVEIGRQHMIDAERDIDVEAVLVPNLGTGLDAADHLPEGRDIGSSILQAIEQDMLDLVRGQEGPTIPRQLRPFFEIGEAQAARSLGRLLRVHMRQPAQIAPRRDQRGAALRQGVAKIGIERVRRLHLRKMET